VRLTTELPEFPWDLLAGHGARARAHPDGVINLSVGTPVDPVPPFIRDALASVADAPGYPTTHGTPELRKAAVDALRRRHGVPGVEPDAVLPTIGSKELVAWLPTLLGVRPGDTVVIPSLAYPTYEVGVRLAGATLVRSDSLLALGTENSCASAEKSASARRPVLIWLNSPSNPTGRVLPVEHLRKVVDWARERDAIVVSDECYLTLGWDAEPVSVLHPDVCAGRFDGLLAVHSLSKCSSLAGYRAGFVTGDPALVARLLEVRRHAGMIVPRPVQAAMTAALSDDDHVAAQRARFAARRALLLEALQNAEFRIDHSEAGLYLWATRGEDAWSTIAWLADRGILAAPGTFYGPTGTQHIRVALTESDTRVAEVAARVS
jgi:succinyldiaminopimelate transaminase